MAWSGGNAEETAVSSAPPPFEAADDGSTATAVAPPTAPPLSMETVVAQTRTAEQTNGPPRLNHYVGVQLDLPVDWELATNDSFLYRGRNGSFRISIYSSSYLNGLSTLAEVCASDEAAVSLNTAGYEREMTEINGRYFGWQRGITWYHWMIDQQMDIHGIAIAGTLTDAPYLLDGLLEQETHHRPTELITDTGGYSNIVFGFFRLLGYRFSPRLADLGDARFWRMNRQTDYGILDELAWHKPTTISSLITGMTCCERPGPY